MFEKSKEISSEIDEITKKQKLVKENLDNILSNLPNVPHPDVPIGKDENDNIEIGKFGKIPNFEFEPKSHYEIGENLKMLDFDLATKTTGARFVFVKNRISFTRASLIKFYVGYSYLKKWIFRNFTSITSI